VGTSMCLTKSDVDALPATGIRYRVPEGKVPGLYVQVGASGTKSFVLVYRHQGRQRWLTLGKYGSLTLEEARTLAKARGGEVASGADPAAEKKAERLGSTLSEIAKSFLEDYCPTHTKPATEATYKSIVNRKILPILGSLKLDAIDAPTVARWHRNLKKTPREANQALAILSKMLNLAESWGCRKPGLGNPCKSITRYEETKRDRALCLDEIRALFASMDFMEKAHQDQTERRKAFTAKKLSDSKSKKGSISDPTPCPDPHAPPEALDCLRLILYTGARRDEIRLLTWDEVNLKCDPPVLHLRRGKEVKKGDQKGKTIALSDLAVALLQRQVPRLGNPYVFPGRDSKHRHGAPLVGLWKIWHRILEHAKIDPACIHDMRHSFGTLAGALGLSGPLIQAALNHSSPAMTSRYTNLKTAQKLEVAEAVALALQSAISKKA
jgi:integrase